MKKFVQNKNRKLFGSCVIPSDKSISHRAVLFSALANGKSIIRNFSMGKDPNSTLQIVKNLGVDIEFKENNLVINSTGVLKSYPNVLDCGNSGTTMRLLSGVLAAQNFNSTLTGDESLSLRPMKRIIEPLSQMGAKIDSNDYKAPLKIYGQDLAGINYASSISSAQVKSCVLLAGLYARGETAYKEPYLSRNHTEIMLKYMGADIQVDSVNNITTIKQSKLNPINISIAGDISSAAYFIVAGLIVPNSEIILKNVGLNPTRTGIIDVVKLMGGDIEILDAHNVCGEIVGDMRVRYTPCLKACNISGSIIPRLIDEIPVIAVLASQAEGETVISGAQDLRNKESDRIKLIVLELSKMGIKIEELTDGMIIAGKSKIRAISEVDCYKDHRLAMSLYVAGLISQNGVIINDFEWTNISFPEFEKLFESIQS